MISVARAERGTAGAVLGTLTAPGGGARGGGDPVNGSAIEAAVSPDGQFAFVTLEYADKAVVFNLARALRDGFVPADYVGATPLGLAAVGMAISPDGRWLYATSERRRPSGSSAVRPGGLSRPGTLTVVSVGDSRRTGRRPIPAGSRRA